MFKPPPPPIGPINDPSSGTNNTGSNLRPPGWQPGRYTSFQGTSPIVNQFKAGGGVFPQPWDSPRFPNDMGFDSSGNPAGNFTVMTDRNPGVQLAANPYQFTNFLPRPIPTVLPNVTPQPNPMFI